jgi:hypothetical protein
MMLILIGALIIGIVSVIQEGSSRSPPTPSPPSTPNPTTRPRPRAG